MTELDQLAYGIICTIVFGLVAIVIAACVTGGTNDE